MVDSDQTKVNRLVFGHDESTNAMVSARQLTCRTRASGFVFNVRSKTLTITLSTKCHGVLHVRVPPDQE